MISINNLRTSASYSRASDSLQISEFSNFCSSSTTTSDSSNPHPSHGMDLQWPGWGSLAWPRAGWTLTWGQGTVAEQSGSWLLTWGAAVQGPGHEGEWEELPKNQPWSLPGSAPGRKCGDTAKLSTKIHQWRSCYMFYLRNRGETQRQFWKTSSCSSSLKSYTQVF